MKRVVLVGATDGLGRALAAEYASRGGWVTILGRSAGKLDALVADLSARHPAATIRGVVCDLADAARIEPAFREALEATGHCDLFLYNAGVMHAGDGLTCDPANDAETMNVNAVAAVRMLGLAANYFRARAPRTPGRDLVDRRRPGPEGKPGLQRVEGGAHDVPRGPAEPALPFRGDGLDGEAGLRRDADARREDEPLLGRPAGRRRADDRGPAREEARGLLRVPPLGDSSASRSITSPGSSSRGSDRRDRAGLRPRSARSRARRGVRPLQLLRVRRSTGPSSVEELAAMLADCRARGETPVFRGAGRSYGDAALNPGRTRRRTDAAERDPQPRRRDGDRPRGRGPHARRALEGRRPEGILAARRNGHDARHARRRRRRQRPRQERLEARDDRRPRRERHASSGADGTLEEIGRGDSRAGRRRREHARRRPGRRGRPPPQEARGRATSTSRASRRGTSPRRSRASTGPRTTGNTSSAGWTAGRPGRALGRSVLHVANEHVPAAGRAGRASPSRSRSADIRTGPLPVPLLLLGLKVTARGPQMRLVNSAKFLAGAPRGPGAVPPVARRVLVPPRLRARAGTRPTGPAASSSTSSSSRRRRAEEAFARALVLQQEAEVVSSLAVVKRHRAGRARRAATRRTASPSRSTSRSRAGTRAASSASAADSTACSSRPAAAPTARRTASARSTRLAAARGGKGRVRARRLCRCPSRPPSRRRRRARTTRRRRSRPPASRSPGSTPATFADTCGTKTLDVTLFQTGLQGRR